MSEKIGLYPGSFDPITNGHMDIMRRSLKVVDKLVVGIAINVSKAGFFNLDERVKLVEEDIDSLGLSGSIKVDSFEGLLVKYARDIGASIIIRGLRAVSDFEYEFRMALIIRKLNDSFITIFIIPIKNYTLT